MTSSTLRVLAAASAAALLSAPVHSGMFEVKTDDASVQFGGRLQTDWSVVDEDAELEAAIGNQNGGHEFRRARLFVAGTLYESVIFKAEYDFASGGTNFLDAYVGFTGGFGTLKMGHMKEPFSLELMTSSRFITFLERSLPDSLVPGFNSGIMWNNSFKDERATLAAGVFKDAGANGSARGEDDYAFTARGTALPWYEDRGRQLFHVGAAVRYSEPSDKSLRFSSRPEIHTASSFIDTASFDAESDLRFGIEGAVVNGPFSLQGEYIVSSADAAAYDDPSFNGFYIYGSYFLTGESRAYSTADGAFTRTKPTQPLTGKGGTGAWELTARVSQLDLTDGLVAGGELLNFTGGINWYPNPYTRMMINFVHADLDKVGNSNAFLARFQVDF